MFQTLRYQLLVSYLAVLTLILCGFSIAVRVTFAHSLRQQLVEKLTALGQGAAANVEFDNGQTQADSDFSTQDLVRRDQALEWFDLQGKSIGQQGQNLLTTPIDPQQPVQFEADRAGVIVPMIDADNGKLVGYIRASQSLQDIDDTLRRLDWGLGGGVVAALVLSGMGGIWLTRQAMQPIEQSFGQLQQFTADASHELRSPLMAIKSNTAVALKYPTGMRASDAEKFEAIASATSQMTRLTEDLLLLARSDRVTQLERKAVDLAAMLKNLVQLYQPEATAKQITLRDELPNALWVTGDAVQLTRLFTNLFVNALHYTLAEGSVTLRGTQKGNYAQIKIQDTGIGIAPEHLDHIFDRFWRADQSRAYWSGGSGLGLAIAQGIAQTHNGSIAVSSQLGVGSCFTVKLPVRSAFAV